MSVCGDWKKESVNLCYNKKKADIEEKTLSQEQIIELCESRVITQLAKKSGIHINTFSSTIRGKRVRKSTLMLISKYLKDDIKKEYEFLKEVYGDSL